LHFKAYHALIAFVINLTVVVVASGVRGPAHRSGIATAVLRLAVIAGAADTRAWGECAW
jgi:hypothetical protein